MLIPLRLRKLKKHKILTVLCIISFYVLCRIISPPILSDVSFSREVYDKNNILLRITLSGDEKYRLYTHLDQVSPQMVQVIIMKEDRFFYYHPGINPISMARAFRETYIQGDRRIGASTITMQLARLYYKVDSSNFLGKIAQILLALELELFHSKDEILESYLNLLPFGGNIEGIRAASRKYFNKTPDKLNIYEAVSLCVIPQSPAERITGGTENREFINARIFLFKKWLESYYSPEINESNINIPFSNSNSNLPFLAPHFVTSVLANTDGNTIITTLDNNLQEIINTHVRSYVDINKTIGIYNASVLLLNYETMGIEASVGSSDFFSDEISGQVDGTRARRSPGSTIKPFIYALGFDQGMIHTLSLLKDSPIYFVQYTPENFDGQFQGPVMAKDALIQSRNVPAIHVTLKLKNPTLYNFLIKANVSGLGPEEHYGLALVLGGAEIPMYEMVGLYAVLANGGICRRIKEILRIDGRNLSEEDELSERLLSPEACFMTLDILTECERPEKFKEHGNGNSFPIAWKTGTSPGYRDAWSISVFGPYVLAVWIGNFDCQSNPIFVGVKVAAPLMFEIIEALRLAKPNLKPFTVKRAENIKQVKVCAVSGQMPGPFCDKTKEAWFIPGKSPIGTCSVHRKVNLNSMGRRTCSGISTYAHSEIYEFWPSDLLMLFKEAGIPRKIPPPFAPECSQEKGDSTGLSPKIISPTKEAIYCYQKKSESSRIAFIVTVDADVKSVFWFLNDDFLGKTDSASPFYWTPEPGKYLLRVVDDFGRADSISLNVEAEK